jgi:hypothetical protein
VRAKPEPGDMSAAEHPAGLISRHCRHASTAQNDRPQWAESRHAMRILSAHHSTLGSARGMNAVASTSMRTCREGSMPLTSTTVLTGGSAG